VASRARTPEGADLDVVPIMSLIMHLIPMLLLSVRFTYLAQLPSGRVVPSVPAPSGDALAEQEAKVVSVRITAQGFTVGGLGGDHQIPCTAALCAPDTYDYASLTAAMVEAKRQHPTETRVVVAPGRDTPYEVVIAVMGATRSRGKGAFKEVLFPNALLADDGVAP
jgi:biopolymer transport protein ExbD